MTATVAPLDPVLQIAEALALVRSNRHHSTCSCGMYRDAKHSPFCSLQESVGCIAIDRLLDQCLSDRAGTIDK